MNKLLIILSILTITTLSSCKKGNSTITGDADITIAYLPITHALPIVDLTSVKGVKVKLVKYGSWPELLDAVNTGRVNGASVLIELAMKAKAKGIRLSAYALGHKDGNVIIVSKGIKGATGLIGKTFAIPHRCSSHYILVRKMLEKNNIGEDRLNIVEMSPSEMPSALANGQISGYCVAEPFGTVSINNGKGKVLYRSEELWHNSICCALVFNDNAVKDKADKVKKLLTAYQTEGKALDDKSMALKKSKKILSQSDAVLRQSLQWIRYDDLNITREAYQSLSDNVKKYGIIKNPPTYQEFIK